MRLAPIWDDPAHLPHLGLRPIIFFGSTCLFLVSSLLSLYGSLCRRATFSRRKIQRIPAEPSRADAVKFSWSLNLIIELDNNLRWDVIYDAADIYEWSIINFDWDCSRDFTDLRSYLDAVGCDPADKLGGLKPPQFTRAKQELQGAFISQYDTGGWRRFNILCQAGFSFPVRNWSTDSGPTHR